jgi:hypothetical protein
MNLCRVLIPFTLSDTKKAYVPNDEIELTDEQLARVRVINVNMVEVVGKVEEKPKRKTSKK